MRGTTLISLALAFAALASACSSDPVGAALDDDGGVPALDAGGGGTPVMPDSGGIDSGQPDAAPKDTTAPLAVADLAATTDGHTSIGLTWTAPSDPPGGNVSSYEVRRSKTNITTDAEFAAGTPVTVGAPKPANSAESFVVNGLDPDTTYYFAIRAKDAAGNVGPLSNVASAKTKARAALLVSEIAMMNATGTNADPGFDFVELLVTSAGSVKGIEVRQAGSPSLLHTFADLDVAVGDRIVVHLTGLPGPSGFAQEDAAKSKTASTELAAFASNDAYDVYSSAGGTGLAATDNLVSIVDGPATIDAVAYSQRDGDAAAASMTAFAAAHASTAWTFGAVPDDGTNDCETQRDAVAISTTNDITCGQFATGMAAKKSINRNGTTDTNGKADFYVGAQTPGAANVALPAPKVIATTATSATSVELRFDQELAAGTVTAAAFTGSGITISAATLSDVSLVTLTTSSQSGPHTIGIGSALKSIQGASVDATASTVRFCGFSANGGLVMLMEVNPLIPANASGAELIELLATRAGLLTGFNIRLNPTAAAPAGTNVATFPSGLCVATGDIVVVHAQPPPDIVAPTSETVTKNEHPAATYSAHYDGAWDVRGLASAALPNGDAVLAVRDADGTYVDAIVYTDANGTTTAAFRDALYYAQSLGLWVPSDCDGLACTDATTPTAEGIAVSSSGAGTSASGASMSRLSASLPPRRESWSVVASSWGASN